MRNLFLFIKQFYPLFLFLFLEIIAFILISGSNAYHHTTFVNSSHKVTGVFYEKQDNITEYFELKQVNEVLEAENAMLRNKISRFKTLADSGKVDTVGKVVYEFWPANVINHTTQKKYNYFTLDKGKKDGMVEGMGVIDSKGIVGMVTNVSNNYSVGLSMLNNNARTSVKHKKSGAIGLMRWTGNDVLTHYVEDITKTAKVVIGDTMVTSGYSTFYPEGIAVGIVTKAELREGSNFYDIEVRLTSNILSLEKVYVVNHHDKIELDSLENIPE
ncbi:MAG: rod shape-determining protein MreC [Chitinophagales bacterium]